MKGLLENHLNVAALDNDETNKRLTFLFRFEEEFRIPLVKRQQFNSSEAQGLLVIGRGCSWHSANGHGTGFPKRSLCRGSPRKPPAGGVKGDCFERPGAGLGNSTGLECRGFPLWKRQRAVSLSCTGRYKPYKPTAGQPSLCPKLLHPLLRHGLHKKMWCCVQWKDHVNELWGRNLLPRKKGLGQAHNITEPGNSPLLRGVSPYTALQGWFWYKIWMRRVESTWALYFSLLFVHTSQHNLINISCHMLLQNLLYAPGTSHCNSWDLLSEGGQELCWITHWIPAGSTQWIPLLCQARVIVKAVYLFGWFKRVFFQKRKLSNRRFSSDLWTHGNNFCFYFIIGFFVQSSSKIFLTFAKLQLSLAFCPAPLRHSHWSIPEQNTQNKIQNNFCLILVKVTLFTTVTFAPNAELARSTVSLLYISHINITVCHSSLLLYTFKASQAIVNSLISDTQDMLTTAFAIQKASKKEKSDLSMYVK